MYIVLGVLYESYIHPITILSTLPSAGVGAILALTLFHMDLGVMALIGIILLIGIVKKNAIMMIDFALEAERKEGKKPVDAIYEACLLRFRPIMMTTFAALFGAVPLALGSGTGSELRRPLGVTIIGGLLVSQMLTLLHDSGRVSVVRPAGRSAAPPARAQTCGGGWRLKRLMLSLSNASHEIMVGKDGKDQRPLNSHSAIDRNYRARANARVVQSK